MVFESIFKRGGGLKSRTITTHKSGKTIVTEKFSEAKKKKYVYDIEMRHIGKPKARPKVLEKYPIKTEFVKYEK